MSTNNICSLVDFHQSWKSNKKYFEMLGLLASFSKLFSESDTPFLDYRLAENLFCKYFNAYNDARSCTAYDAHFETLGIGIKTFILNDKNESTEKIAEFNKLRGQLDRLRGIDLARKLGEFRNERMRLANDTYNLCETQYHIVGRLPGRLRVFNCPYEFVDVDNIKVIKDKDVGITFTDGNNEYNFIRSKTVLMKRFFASDYEDINVEILHDPLALLESMLTPENETEGIIIEQPKRKGIDYVILPLYSTRDKNVPKHSGLNQWNAGGRRRDENEVYIPVPKAIHNNWPDFFPQRDEPFELILPDKKILSAKICQEGEKALMSNPNSALGEWLLRKVIHKAPGTLVTMEDLNLLGIDSVIIYKEHKTNNVGQQVFRIHFSDNYENYMEFIE